MTQLSHLYKSSHHTATPLFSHYFSDSGEFDVVEAQSEQQEIKATLSSDYSKDLATFAESLTGQLDSSSRYSLDLGMEKGSSTWLSALPLKSHGFHLHKSAFRDAIHLRYGWAIPNTPSICSCGQPFHIEHVLSCTKGGFPSIRHNEVRDTTASLLSEVCSNVEVEPHLQPLTEERLTLYSANSEPNARLDLAANGVWGGRFERTYFDVRVFNPFAKSNLETPLAETYRKHEREKCRKYEQRVIDIEHSSFTLLLFSATGGMSKLTSNFYRHLAERLSEKKQIPYSVAMGLIRCRLCFALLRAAIMCIRGARSSKQNPIFNSPFELQVAEGHLVI